MLSRLGPYAWYYWFWINTQRLALKLLARWQVDGSARCPRNGPLIVVANHVSYADPSFVGATLPRRLRFMAKQELFDRKFMGAHVRMFGSYPVRRFDADLGALRTSLDILASGDAIAIFPEGTRSKDSTMHRAYPGVGFIAVRSGAPVLPVAVHGTEALMRKSVFWKRPRVYATVGEPITFASEVRVRSADAEAATERIMGAIAALLPPPNRGVYADIAAKTPGTNV